MAECRIQLGEVAEGIADLADLLAVLEDHHQAEAVAAVEEAIAEAVPLLTPDE